MTSDHLLRLLRGLFGRERLHRERVTEGQLGHVAAGELLELDGVVRVALEDLILLADDEDHGLLGMQVLLGDA